MTTNPFPSDVCAMCGKTFQEAIDNDQPGEWTVHWEIVVNGTKITAETCGPTCADMFEQAYRKEGGGIK